MKLLPALSLCVLLLPTASTSAQSIWGVNGLSTTAENVSGPPVGPCSYPTGPLLGGFNYTGGAICPTPGTFGASTLATGDIAVVKQTDTVYITDGNLIAGYTRTGTHLTSFPNPMPNPLTGLGSGGPATGFFGGVLWLTDGNQAMAISAPTAGCPGAFGVVVPPFPVLFPGQATDIDFDPLSGTLFLSNANGLVTNELIGGGAGPFGAFAPAACTIATPFLDGIAVDTSACKALYVHAPTGSFIPGSISRIDFTGAPAAPTFYAPQSCFPYPGSSPIGGLAFDATPVPYAKSCRPGGVAGPTFTATHQAVSPNPAFGLRMTGATPGSQAFLVIGAGALCPPAVLSGGCGLAVAPITVVGPLPVPITGTIDLPAAIPAGISCPPAVYLQWANALPLGGGAFEVSNALETTISLP